MNRRLLTILLPFAAATLAAGCTTFSDNDAIARVGDTELSPSALDDLIAEGGAQVDPSDETLPLAQARPVITQWIQQTIIDGELFTPDMLDAVPDDVLANSYREGLDSAGVSCPLAIGTASLADAQAAADRLRGGEDFADVFGAANIDPGFAETDGDVGCVGGDQISPELSESPPIVALRALTADNAIEVAESPAPDGSSTGIVFVFRDLPEVPEESRGQALDALRQTVGVGEILGDLDIYVNSRYGAFDNATASVVALG